PARAQEIRDRRKAGPGIFRREVKLDASARRNDHRLAHAGRRRAPCRRGGELTVGDGEALAQIDRRGVMAETDAEDFHRQNAALAVMKLSPESVSSTALNAATESQAMRRGLSRCPLLITQM